MKKVSNRIGQAHTLGMTDMRKQLREMSELAMAYAEDGAYLSAGEVFAKAALTASRQAGRNGAMLDHFEAIRAFEAKQMAKVASKIARPRK